MEIRPSAIPEGQAFVLEKPLVDKTNENSCIISYYEIGLEEKDLRNKMTAMVIMQYLN